MKKVVLISFYFSPCTLTPSQRITYWAEHLHKIGIYPIIVTREWTADIKSHLGTKMPLGGSIRHEKHAHYEVYYLPFRPGILDRAYMKWGENWGRPLFLLVKLLDVLLVKFTLKFTSFRSFYPFLEKLYYKEKNIEYAIISGEPFYLFRVGYLASVKLKMKWFADYRDDWTTNELQKLKGNSFLRNIIFKIESVYERKWVGTATKIVSVSDNYVQKISDLVKLEGLTISNGFDEQILELDRLPLFPEFTIAYSGTLYPSQDVQFILEALRICVKKERSFRLVFLGSAFDVKEKKRIASMIDATIKPYVEVTERMPRMEALAFLQKSHILLGISYGNLTGIHPSKLYEFVGLKKPVLLAPTDNDVMEKILADVGTGFFAASVEDCVDHIEKIRRMYENREIGAFSETAEAKTHSYSRFRQMTKIKTLFD